MVLDGLAFLIIEIAQLAFTSYILSPQQLFKHSYPKDFSTGSISTDLLNQKLQSSGMVSEQFPLSLDGIQHLRTGKIHVIKVGKIIWKWMCPQYPQLHFFLNCIIIMYSLHCLLLCSIWLQRILVSSIKSKVIFRKIRNCLCNSFFTFIFH